MCKSFTKVSVIVPIFGVENYLQQCIDSICAQTYRQLEIILVDDGSLDNCGRICDNNSAKDSRIVVIHKENEGLSSARNAGLDIATGHYVVFIDADDTIHPKFIEVLLDICEQYDCDIAQCDFLAIAENSIRLPLNYQQEVRFYNGRQALTRLCCDIDPTKYTVIWNKIYKKELFDHIRFPLGRIHEDEFTTYLVLYNAKKIAITNQYLYYYLKRRTSIMGEKFSVKRLDCLIAFKERLDFLKKNKFEKEYFETLRKYYYLIKQDFIILKQVENCEEICTKLWEEKERVGKQISLNIEKMEKDDRLQDHMMKIDSYPENARIILYGAGYWGRIIYKWICQNCKGKIVGWVDNSWYTIQDVGYPVLPLDSLLSIMYDYILITIKNKIIQEEVMNNLISWGIPKEKIILGFVSES